MLSWIQHYLLDFQYQKKEINFSHTCLSTNTDSMLPDKPNIIPTTVTIPHTKYCHQYLQQINLFIYTATLIQKKLIYFVCFTLNWTQVYLHLSHEQLIRWWNTIQLRWNYLKLPRQVQVHLLLSIHFILQGLSVDYLNLIRLKWCYWSPQNPNLILLCFLWCKIANQDIMFSSDVYVDISFLFLFIFCVSLMLRLILLCLFS